MFVVGYCYKSIICALEERFYATFNYTNENRKCMMNGESGREGQFKSHEERGFSNLLLQAPITNCPHVTGSASFAGALEHMLSLLPDDSFVSDMTGPIEGTGEQKIHEVGVRTRVLKSLFESWELLHLSLCQGQIFARGDILQHLKASPEIAEEIGMSHTDLMHAYEEYCSVLKQLSERLFSWTTPYFTDLMALHLQFWNGKRGIVFTGGSRQAPYLITSIQLIRRIGCDLPIEVMYLGDEDLDEPSRAKLESIPGVFTRDLRPMVNDEGWKLAGWAAKPFAILLSSFREVLFIDADAIFLRDPASLFEDLGYRRTGALFFKDRLLMPESRQAWLKEILPSPISMKARLSRLWTGESGHMQESGVVVVDKWRHFIALLMVTRMNGPDRDGNEAEDIIGVYDMVYGTSCWILESIISGC